MNSALDRWGGVSPTSSAGSGGLPSSADDKNAKKSKKENNVDDTKKNKKKQNNNNKEWAKDSKKKKKQEQQQNQRKNKNKNKNNNTSISSSAGSSSKEKAVLNVSTAGTDGGSGSNNSNSNNRNSNSNSNHSRSVAQTLFRIDIEAPPPIRNILRPNNDYDMNDVSTIAGDTFFVGDIMDANMAEAVPPMPSSNRHSRSQSAGPKGDGTIYPIDRHGNFVTNGSGGDALQIFVSTPKNDTIDGCDSGSTKPITPEKDDDDDSDDSDDSDWVPEDYDDDDDEDDEYDYIYDDDEDDNVFDDVEEYYNDADGDGDADNADKEEINNNEVAAKMKKRRKKKKRNINTSIDSDVRVLPLGDASNKKKLKKKKKPSSGRRRRFKCIMCMGCSLVLFLLFGIALLGYTLYAVRNEKDDALSLFDKQFWIDAHNDSHPIFHKTFWKQAGQKLLFWKEFDNEINDSNSNITGSDNNETMLSQENEPITSRNDNNNNNNNSTADAATIPLSKEVTDELLREKIRSMILTALSQYQRSSSLYNRPGGNYNAELILQDTTSLQYSIIEWLVNDPNIDNYSNSKIIQRYALGCFYQNLANNNDGDDITNDDVKSTWMSYGDECVTWASTDSMDVNNMNDNRSSNGMCTSSNTRIGNTGIGIDTTNGENVDGGIDLVDGKITRQVDSIIDYNTDITTEDGGNIVSIHLENVGLNGTLVPELVLLSDSLESIYLTKNNIRGEIPWTVFSQMINLKRLQLSRNNLDGTAFPSQEGLPTKLEILGLGQNNLSGSIPSTLVLPKSLIYLNIPHNQLTGILPSEIWNNSTLEHISFESNNLTGPIPSQLIMNNLDSLKTVLLSGNDLTGNIPQEVCVEGTIDIAVDCDLVYCSCCAISNCSTIFSSNAATEEGLTFFEVESGDVVGTSITVSSNATNTTSATNTIPVSAATSSPSVTPTSAAPTIDPYLYPYIDNATMAAMIKESNSSTATTTASSPLNTTASAAVAMTTTNSTTNTTTVNYSSSSCHVIDVGFSCYDTGYSIDFETSNMCGGGDDVDPLQEYDIIALFPYVVDNNDDADDDWDDDDDYSSTLSPSELQAAVTRARAAATTITTNSSVGTMKSLNESLYWATSCGLSEGCDGVISSPGKIYYRNMYPTRMISPNDSKLIWPIPVYAGDSDGSSSLFQLTLVRVNSIGDGIILAESRPFIVSDRCS